MSLTEAGESAVTLLREDPEISLSEVARRSGLSRTRVVELDRQMQHEQWFKEQVEAERHKPVTQRRVKFLPLTTRTLNALANAGKPHRYPLAAVNDGWQPPTARIESVEDLLQWSDTDLLRVENFGRRCLEELIRCLADFGVSLHEAPPRPPRRMARERCPHCGGTGRR